MRKRHCVYRVYREQVFFFSFPPLQEYYWGGVCGNRKTQGSNDSNPFIRLTAVFFLLIAMENWEMIENESERGEGGKRERERDDGET